MRILLFVMFSIGLQVIGNIEICVKKGEKMKKLLIVALALGCLGCKGPAGSQGANGKNGKDGSSPIIRESEILTGSITSNDFTTYNSDLGQASQISIWLSDGSKATELPFFLPSLGINAYYLVDANSVRFVNCQYAGNNYIICLTFI